MKIYFIWFWLIIALISCAGKKLYLNTTDSPIQDPPKETPSYTLYALGDAGEINEQSKAVVGHLAKISSDDLQPGMVLFLGDNIYPSGLQPEWNTQAYQEGQDILMNQIFPLSDYEGRIVFIPGNHDWNEFKPGGLASIRRQGAYLHALDSIRIQLLPENGCSGPVPIPLTQNVLLLIIDSQWWMQQWEDEPEMNEGCENKSREDFIRNFHALVDKNKGKQILVALHHPLYTQGPHGGHFTIREHLFPLSKVVDWLFLPLPVIGSIYPLYRTVFGHPQDLKHPGYKSLKDNILKDLEGNGELIFLSGHEHNLQYIRTGGNHFLISGAGSRKNAIRNTKELVYGHKAGGLMQLDIFEKEGIRLTIFEYNPKSKEVDTLYSRFIVEMTKP